MDEVFEAGKEEQAEVAAMIDEGGPVRGEEANKVVVDEVAVEASVKKVWASKEEIQDAKDWSTDDPEIIAKVFDSPELTQEEIAEQLSALRDALIVKEDQAEEAEAESAYQKVRDEQGTAGSRHAFKIDKQKEKDVKIKGQRPGMRIGLPNRLYHQSTYAGKGQLGKGARKIDPNRPVNN